MEIRRATQTDAEAISNLIRLSTLHNPNQYSFAQQNAWINYNTLYKTEKFLLDRIIYCAFENGKLIGTIALKKDEVLGFYVNHQIRNKGIGTALLTHLETEAIGRGIRRLRLTSTPSAEDFYRRKGFRPLKEIVVTIDGVDFPELEMDKILVDNSLP